MNILAAVVVLSVAAGVRPADEVTCPQPILCPCGNTGKNVKVCSEGENPCIRWSKCKICQDGLDGCLECPEGSEDLSCSNGAEKFSRRKRQYLFFSHGRRPGNTPFQVSHQRQDCPELKSPKLGSIRCLYDDRQRTCEGKCLPGYSFEGHGSQNEMTLTCTGDYFTPYREFPPCKSGGDCDLVVHGAGSFNCTTGMSGTRCDVICRGQYTGRYFCYSGQSWEPNLPYCVRPKDIQMDRQTCNCEYGGRCDGNGNCICPSGRTGRYCEKTVPEKRTCRDPGFVENGLRKKPDETDLISRQSFNEGESVVYSCISQEYALQGSSLLTCKNDGKWSSSLPKCIRTMPSPLQMIYCRDPGVDPNGSRDPQSPPHRQGFPQGSSLEFSCNNGYDLQGEKTLFCRTSGRWSSERPTCKAHPRPVVSPPGTGAYCRDPGIDPNGSRNLPSPSRGRGFLEGSRLQYFCDLGYEIEGERSIVCLTSGRWSSQRPSCKPEAREPVCLNPGSILNGRIVYYPPLNRRQGGIPQRHALDVPEYPVGGMLLYSCNSGYTLQGTDSLTCRKTGIWSAEPPVCTIDIQPVPCRNPGSISNGRIVYYPPLVSGQRGLPETAPNKQEYPEGGLLLYSCDSGYNLQGSDSLTCSENGEWSSEPPLCVRDFAYCPNPGTITNGRVVYYPLLGNRRVTSADLDEEEYPEGGRLQYYCDSGYRLQGSEFLTCQRTGRWSAETPVCLRDTVYCPTPGTIRNGRVVYYPSLDNRRVSDANLEDEDYPEGGRLQYSCNNGYRLQGSESSTCQPTGRWSAEPPTCIRVPTVINYCDNPGPIPNGKVEYVPTLNERRPRPPVDKEEYPEYPQGSRLIYSCDIGYTLHGASEMTCGESGAWSANPPSCMSKDVRGMLYCLNPGPILNGFIRYHSSMTGPRSGSTSLVAEDTPEYPEGTTLEFRCDDGYVLRGSVTVKCQSTGLWSALPPTCFAECGMSMGGTTRKILNGNKTEVGEWPWVVAIAVNENNISRIVCGGAVLNTRTVITAAHCLNNGQQYNLYFGKYFRSNSLDDDLVQSATSERLIIHPDYNNVTLDSDIALIKFNPKISYTSRVQPVCLPTAMSTALNLVPEKRGYVTGWGENEKQVDSSELMKARLPFQTNSDCLESFRVNAPNFFPVLTQNMFCAGFPEAQQSTCRGDSGSPFVFYDPVTQRHTIEGLVSYTVEGQCGLPGRYSVYTKVYRFLPWIYRNM